MSEWQDKFDSYLVDLYISGRGVCGYVWGGFCKLHGLDESLGQGHYGIHRYPNNEFAYRTVQSWLYQSYPKFADCVHLCLQKGRPLSGIKLGLIKFVKMKKPMRVGNERVISDLRRAQNKSRASYINHSLRTNNPLNTDRVKMPAPKMARR